MTASKIQVTTGDLRSQASRIRTNVEQLTEASALCDEALELLESACSVFTSGGLMLSASNFQKKLYDLAEKMNYAAILADSSADAYETADNSIISQINGFIGDEIVVSDQVNDYSDIEAADIPPVLDDLSSYNDTVVDAEYARLSGWWEHVCDRKDPVAAFLKELENLPENDPMRHITRDQITYYDNWDGFSAIVIDDHNGSALVIFAGTNPDQFMDLVADGALALGQYSTQELQARVLVQELAKTHDNITVTGHSLGGYLATSAALSEDKVSRCIAFDPPGRYDTVNQKLFNGENYNKVTTYEANGSRISAVGIGVGNVIDVEVEPSGGFISKNHSIDNLGDALGGDDAIENSWRGDDREPDWIYTANDGGGGSW